MVTSTCVMLPFKNVKGGMQDGIGGGAAFCTNAPTMMIDVTKQTIKHAKTYFRDMATECISVRDALLKLIVGKHSRQTSSIIISCFCT